MNQPSLINKSCIPCQAGQPPLTAEAANVLLKEVGNQWRINDQGHLFNQYKFKNFMQAMEFANRIAEIAEQEGHHPDLQISWGSCAVEIWTHKINGLSESDFILAAKIDTILPT
jgi:4a-hydroxytetrahydrobiopterin dehydratase